MEVVSVTKFRDILKILTENEVQFVVIGGVAAILHGSSSFTQDIDLCYDRSPENLERLSRALLPFHPTLRGAPEGLPFHFDPSTIKAGLNFTLSTDLGEVDLFGEVGSLGFYAQVVTASIEGEVHGIRCRLLDLDALIASKKFSGRKKDEEVVLQLEAIRELRKRQP